MYTNEIYNTECTQMKYTTRNEHNWNIQHWMYMNEIYNTECTQIEYKTLNVQEWYIKHWVYTNEIYNIECTRMHCKTLMCTRRCKTLLVSPSKCYWRHLNLCFPFVHYTSQLTIEPIPTGKIRQNVKFVAFWCQFLTKVPPSSLIHKMQKKNHCRANSL